jgi:hypothetical protein
VLLVREKKQKKQDKSTQKKGLSMYNKESQKVSSTFLRGILLILFLIILTLPASFALPNEQSGTFSNVRQFSTQEFANLGQTSAFTRITAQFSQNYTQAEYTLKEQSTTQSYRDLEISLPNSAVSSLLFSLRVERSANIASSGSTLSVYGLRNAQWTKYNLTLIRSDSQYLYYTLRTPQITRLILGEDIKLQQVISGASTQNSGAQNPQSTSNSQNTTQNQSSQNQGQGGGQNPSQSSTTQTSSVTQTVVTREFSGVQSRLPIYIVVGLVVVIGVIIFFKQRLRSTQTPAQERESLAQSQNKGSTYANTYATTEGSTNYMNTTLNEASRAKSLEQMKAQLQKEVVQKIKEGKSNGQIVSALMQQGYDISDIVETLQKNGRKLSPSDT